MHRSWPICFLSLAGGILLAHFHAGLIGLFVIASVLLAYSYWRVYDRRFTMFLLLVAVGLFNYQLRVPGLPSPLEEQKEVRICGDVEGIPYFDGEKTSFTLQTVDPSPYRRHIRVVCLFKGELSRGDFVQLRGDLKPPRRPGNPGEFDYPAYLAEQGIFCNLTVKHSESVVVIRAASGPLHWLDRFRRHGEELTRQVLSPQEASILLGMLLGGQAGMEEQLYTDFQKTGIVHLFSVGGLHVSFLLLLVSWLVSLARLSTRTRFGAGAAVLLLYGTMVGWPAPVIRSVVMGILGLLAYYSGRDNRLTNALAISGVVILLIDPGALLNLSFQLTFLATWGLVCLFPLLRRLPGRKSRALDIVLLPLAAELAVLPLVAYHFNMFTPVSILTNILTTYLAGGAVILGFTAMLLSGILPAAAALLLHPAGLFIEIILWIVEQLKILPYAYIWVSTPALAMVGLYYLGLAGLVLKWPLSDRIRRMGALALISVFIISLLLPAGCYQRGRLEIVFIDVGQGDAILLKSPGGRFVLVDGGGSQFYDVGAQTVLPYLHHRGIRCLDMIINTHPDIDHLQGLEAVAREVPTLFLGLPASVIDCPEYDEIKRSAINRQVKIIPLSGGQVIRLEEGMEIRVLHPSPEVYYGRQYNQESVVLEVSYQEFSALLSGDITSEFMPAIAEQSDRRQVVVKVPHHGSKGSLSAPFYQVLHPRHAVISVGEDNPFGHPAAPVLEMLEEQGITIWRTDRDGAVVVQSDGKSVSVQPTIAGDR